MIFIVCSYVYRYNTVPLTRLTKPLSVYACPKSVESPKLTDNAIAKRKKTNNITKTQHRKLIPSNTNPTNDGRDQRCSVRVSHTYFSKRFTLTFPVIVIVNCVTDSRNYTFCWTCFFYSSPVKQFLHPSYPNSPIANLTKYKTSTVFLNFSECLLLIFYISYLDLSHELIQMEDWRVMSSIPTSFAYEDICYMIGREGIRLWLLMLNFFRKTT